MPDRKPVRRRERPPPPPARPVRTRGPLPAGRRSRIPWWAIALVAVACFALVYLVVTSASDPVEQTTPQTGDGVEVDDGSSPSPGGTGAVIASRFPAPAVGDRLQLRVVSLGDDPRRCEAASLRIGGDVRTAYHHRCSGVGDEGTAFFLARMTGLSGEPVTVDVRGFRLVTVDGSVLEPLDMSGVNRRFPEQIALGLEVSRRGWVLFEDAGIPAELRYVDEIQTLAVRFPDSWL